MCQRKAVRNIESEAVEKRMYLKHLKHLSVIAVILKVD